MMSRLRRWLFILTVLSTTLPRIAQAISAENRHFQSALENLRAGFFEKAEREFAQFSRQFPDSARLPEAILCQAEARLKQTNYDGAIELLSVHQHQAGKWADSYLFWLGESYSAKGDYEKAAEEFAKLTREFPASSRLVEASVREATARSRLKPPDWPRVIELLQQTNEVFQAATRTNAASEWVPRGYLLLSEAFLAQTNYHAAEATLLPLGNRLMNPATAWEWQYLICRAQLADGRAEAALLSTSNLLMFARSAEQPSLQAQSAAFKGSVLERLGRFDQAIDAYQTNLAPPAPAQFQRQALFKITELSLAQNKIADAAEMLEKFLAQYPRAAAADLAWLTLGELRLRQLAAAAGANNLGLAGTNGTAATNLLSKARSAFETLTQQFPRSQRFGLAELNLGWCFWLEGNFAQSLNSFEAAVARLPVSPDLARAHFKLADAQFRQKNFAGAITNYSAILEKFASFPEAETNFFEPALYQIVQAGLAAGDLRAVTNALEKILAWYPNGFHTDRAVLLTGQELARQGNPARAREILSAFVSQAPNAPLLPEVKLAIARAYEQENNLGLAIQEYEGWLAVFTNHPARPRAEYCRALAYFHAGDETNALNSFTNFVVQFPTSEFAPAAQQWVAYYYYNAGDFNLAERDFQLLYRTWPASDLACPAWLMAGRAAFMRQSWENAKDYFVKLYDQTNCPAEVRVQALFAYGDYWISRDSTNKASDFLEAVRIFNRISQENPTNQIGLLALGAKANALLQSGQFDEAAKTYQQLTNSPFADLTTRCRAIIGLAVVLEKQAEQKDPSERAPLLMLALDCCLDVLFPEKSLRDGEEADPFWTKEAGLKAIRLAEALGDWRHVISVSQELCRLMPVLCPSMENKILKAQENLRAQN